MQTGLMPRVLCPVVVGRDAELAELRRALAEGLEGDGQTVVLVGEPGVGKSRLTRELATLASARGARVVSGRAVPSSKATPYRPLTEVLFQLWRSSADAEAWSPLPEMPGVMSGLVDAAKPASPVLRGEELLRLLQRLAPEGVVVVLEDLHWADPDTIAVAEYVADNIGGQPLLFVWTLRDSPRSLALDAARRMRGRRGVVHLELDRLSDPDVDAMVRACTSRPDDALLARIRTAAEGVPLLVEEVLAAPGLPGSFADTVRERLGAFRDRERSVIEAAAVLGRHFDWEVLPTVCGQSIEVVTGALGQAVDSLLMSVSGTQFAFRHALTREAVLDTILPPRQRMLATAALDALGGTHLESDDAAREVSIDLAIRAGDRSRAGLLLRVSGQYALGLGALATAVETLRRAVDLLAGTTDQADVELLLIEALALAGRVDEAAAEGGRLLARLGISAETRPTRVETHLRLAHAGVAASRWQMARNQLDEVRRLGSIGSPATRARMTVLDADVAFAADDVDLARSLAESVLEIDGALAETRCHAFEIIGRAHRFVDLAAARKAFEQSLAIAETNNLLLWKLRAIHEVGTIDLLHHAGVERLLEARTTAEAMGAISTAAILDLQLSAGFTCRWDLKQADAHAHSAIAIAEPYRLDQIRAKAYAMLAGTASMRADLAETERFMALARAVAPDDRMLDGFGWGCRGVALLLQGDTAGAIEPYARGIAIHAALPHAEPAALRALWPLVLASRSDRRAAAAVDEARRLGVDAFHLNRALIGYTQAVLAGRGGDRRRANELVATSDPGFTNCGGWMFLARLLAAPSAAADGWSTPMQWLEEARTGFEQLGLAAMAQRCHELLGVVRPNPWADTGITTREADVLRLLVEGSTNKEIATVLDVSPRTVEKHVESLLRKTGARSRTELASMLSFRAMSRWPNETAGT